MLRSGLCQEQCCWKMPLLKAVLFLIIVLINVNAEEEDTSLTSQLSKQNSRMKRGGGSKFLGMRGKKVLCGTTSCPNSLTEMAYQQNPWLTPQSSFTNKRYQGLDALIPVRNADQLTPYDDNRLTDNNWQFFLDPKRSKGFVGMRGKKQPLDGDQKRGPDSGKFFAAMRGKRERQGFYGLRGKRTVNLQSEEEAHQ